MIALQSDPWCEWPKPAIEGDIQPWPIKFQINAHARVSEHAAVLGFDQQR